ncbi:MAG: hypothetical protein KAQ66_03395 [Rhodospirillaceae bacterium]|nr:hypothetical protein [Rhodospirillaceae bacterium]MCK5546072.1 hypothetical protein [Rhodospirillaceae bacterium]
MKRIKSVLTLTLAPTLALAAVAMVGSFVFSNTAEAKPKDMKFTITKGGDPIGTHVFKFSGDENKLRVVVETHTKVKVLFLNFTYDHKRTERWSGEKFVSLKSKTNDDGTPHKLAIKATKTKIRGMANGKPISKDGVALPVTFWNPDVLLNKNLFSALHGKDFKLKWKKLPDEKVMVEGKMVKAKVYETKSASGDLDRKLWYSKDGEFLKTTFKKKGYDIAWIRE